jgi:hypothetical protein
MIKGILVAVITSSEETAVYQCAHRIANYFRNVVDHCCAPSRQHAFALASIKILRSYEIFVVYDNIANIARDA